MLVLPFRKSASGSREWSYVERIYTVNYIVACDERHLPRASFGLEELLHFES